MRSAQDQFRQKSRKVYESQLFPKEDILRQLQLNADPEDLWQIKLVCDDEKSVSDNESVIDRKENVKTKNHKYGEERHRGEQELRKQCVYQKTKLDHYGYTSGECTDPDDGDERRCRFDTRTDSKRKDDHCCCHASEVIDNRACCKYKPKVKNHTCNRHRNPKEETADHRKMSPRGKYPNFSRGRYMKDDDKMQRCGEWCSRYQHDDPRNVREGSCDRSQTPVDLLKYSEPYKHVHHKSPDQKWRKEKDDFVRKIECPHHGQQKLKILDTYEELPVVDESQEQKSDKTYKASSYTKMSSSQEKEPGIHEKGNVNKSQCDRTSSWFMCDKMADRSDTMSFMMPERAYKARSRRTRMNRGRYIKWKKALIHPVVEGSKKEMVGVMVWGQSGPEYYSKRTYKKHGLPFRKSRSFPEDPAKSSDMPLSYETKDMFLSKSEPGRKPKVDLREPEEENKIEEKIATYDKNMDEIVKTSQENFLKELSKEQFNEVDSDKPKDKKIEKELVRLMPYELLSSRAPKSMGDVIAFNVESQILANTLNEKAKQFRKNSDPLADLEKKFPPQKLDKEKVDANLELWGMKLDEAQKIGGEGDAGDAPSKVEQTAPMSVSEIEKISDEMYRERKKKRREVDAAVLEKALVKKLEPETKSPQTDQKVSGDELVGLFRNLVKDGCAISEKESENLQRILTSMVNEYEGSSTETESKTSYETVQQKKEDKKWRKKMSEDGQSSAVSKKFAKRKEDEFERKMWKLVQSKQRDLKSKKGQLNLEKMKLKMIRKALPSIAAENEAAHLRQLKKYISRFIDEVELKISSPSEMRTRRQIKSKQRESSSSDSSEVRVDAKKLIDLVSNPFKRITSDMTIDMAKKLTDALVQENSLLSSKQLVSSSKTRKYSENTEDASIPCPTSSGSVREEEIEPSYLEGLKKMRNNHLSNIMLEVRRLKELLRFLDRCNSLKL